MTSEAIWFPNKTIFIEARCIWTDRNTSIIRFSPYHMCFHSVSQLVMLPEPLHYTQFQRVQTVRIYVIYKCVSHHIKSVLKSNRPDMLLYGIYTIYICMMKIMYIQEEEATAKWITRGFLVCNIEEDWWKCHFGSLKRSVDSRN